MNYINITENFVSTIVSAICIGIVAWVFSRYRNFLLELKLKTAIDPNGIGMSFHPTTRDATFSVQIHNNSHSAIRVRALIFSEIGFFVELRPCEGRIFQTPLSNDMSRSKFKRKILSKDTFSQHENPGAMLLPSKTMGIWEVPPETIGSRAWNINAVFVAFEYSTIFGTSALIRIRANKKTLLLIKDNFEPLSNALHHNLPFDLQADIHMTLIPK